MFARFAQYEYLITASLCVSALVGMGTTLTPTAFRGVVRQPRAILQVIVGQIVVGPLLAIGLARLFKVPTEIAVGMLLVTALPGGLFSNIFTFLSRANVALSVSATAICTLGALVTTTLVLRLFGAAHLPDSFQMPVRRILLEITFYLLLPLLSGMAIRRRWPEKAKPIGKVCVWAATGLMVFYIAAMFQTGRFELFAYDWRSQVAIIALDLLQIVAVIGLGFVFRVSPLDSFTAQIEVVIRNVHLGLLLKASLFPLLADGAASMGNESMSRGVFYVLLYYGGASLISGICMTLTRRTELRVMGDRHRAPPPELQGW